MTQHWIPRRNFWRLAPKPVKNSLAMTSTPSQPFPAPSQGETVSLRLPAETTEVKASVDGNNVAFGTLSFSDGSQKTLAAMTVWLALLLTWERYPEQIVKPPVVQLISSLLLLLKTSYLASESVANGVDAAIHKIVKQNMDSRVQPVDSLTWASILSSMKELTGGAEARLELRGARFGFAFGLGVDL